MLSPFNSHDPAPPDPDHASWTAEALGSRLSDAGAPIFERYRAMFSLRNRGGERSVAALGRARVRWCGFARTGAEMRPAPAAFRYRFLARAETCAPERSLGARETDSPGFWACIDFDCNCAVDFRPKPCGAASKDIVQRTRETMRVGSRSRSAREPVQAAALSI